MSPSRGASSTAAPPPPPPAPTATATSSPTASSSSQASTNSRADAASKSALTSAKHNIAYLFNPGDSAHTPTRFRTRALLRSLRYIGVFVFWRVVRYAKYAVVGSLVAAVAATGFGSMVSGVGFLLAPPTLLTSIGIGAIWSIGKWGFRKTGVTRRFESGAVREVEKGQIGVKTDGQWRDVQGPAAVPW